MVYKYLRQVFRKQYFYQHFYGAAITIPVKDELCYAAILHGIVENGRIAHTKELPDVQLSPLPQIFSATVVESTVNPQKFRLANKISSFIHKPTPIPTPKSVVYDPYADRDPRTGCILFGPYETRNPKSLATDELDAIIKYTDLARKTFFSDTNCDIFVIDASTLAAMRPHLTEYRALSDSMKASQLQGGSCNDEYLRDLNRRCIAYLLPKRDKVRAKILSMAPKPPPIRSLANDPVGSEYAKLYYDQKSSRLINFLESYALYAYYTELLNKRKNPGRRKQK